MNPNLKAELWSFLWIAAVSGAGFSIHRFLHAGAELTRKSIHILVSLWAFILVRCYDDVRWAISGPLMFMGINALFGICGFGRKLLGMEDNRRDIGLVCYPFSLLILTVLMYGGLITGDTVIASTLIMGFGDGLAAVIGTSFGHHELRSPGGRKSLEGSATMLIVSFLVVLFFTPLVWWKALAVGAVAALTEFFAPPSLDNISVPLLSALSIALFL